MCASASCSSSKCHNLTGKMRFLKTTSTMVRCPLGTFSSQPCYKMLRTRDPLGSQRCLQCQSDNNGRTPDISDRRARAKENKSRLAPLKKKDLNSFNHKLLLPFILTHLRVWFSGPWFRLTLSSAGPAKNKDLQQAPLQMCPSCRVS